jgi:triosephosphate isomerase
VTVIAAETVVSPPYVFLPTVKASLRPEIQVAAQNCWVKKGGAFTGEVRLVFASYLCSVPLYQYDGMVCHGD